MVRDPFSKTSVWSIRLALAAAGLCAGGCTQLSGANDLEVLSENAEETLVECHGEWNLCAAGQTAHCGDHGPLVCCEAERATFCDVEGDGYGCWPAQTDCSTLTTCGGDWAACAEGEIGHCSPDDEWFCCGQDEPQFCGADEAAPGCWPADVDCATIARCGSEWLACGSGLQVDCDQEVCVD